MPLPPQTLQIGQFRIRVGDSIAEGGFGYVYRAKGSDGTMYALKVLSFIFFAVLFSNQTLDWLPLRAD